MQLNLLLDPRLADPLILTGEWAMYDHASEYDPQGEVDNLVSKMAWVAILGSLKNLRCISCEGFGHALKDCPTDRELVAIGRADGVWRSIHNLHIQKMRQSNNKTLQGLKPFGSGPKGKKRR